MPYLEYEMPTKEGIVIAKSYNYNSKYIYRVSKYNEEAPNAHIIESIKNSLPLWTTRPTIETVKERFQNGSFVMYQYYKGELSGWFWLNSEFTHDWIDTKPLPRPNSIYIGGMYKCLDQELPADAAMDFGSYVMKYCCENYEYLYAIIEPWNKASVRVFKDYQKFILKESFI